MLGLLLHLPDLLLAYWPVLAVMLVVLFVLLIYKVDQQAKREKDRRDQDE